MDPNWSVFHFHNIYIFFLFLFSSTILVEPNCQAIVTDCGDIRINIEHNKNATDSTELDLVRLSIFQHRFMSIAEQCGRSVFISMHRTSG